MKKFLIDRCRESLIFSWCFAIAGIALMILIALW